MNIADESLPTWSFWDLNNDAILHVLSFIQDASTFLNTASTCLRMREIALSEVESRWCDFYAYQFELSADELKITCPGLYAIYSLPIQLKDLDLTLFYAVNCLITRNSAIGNYKCKVECPVNTNCVN